MSELRLSENGFKFLKTQEGEVLHGYLDSVGKLTVGVGHLVLPGEPYRLNKPITADESTRLLRQDVRRFENCVNNAVTVPLTQNQFDALVSLAFNIGESGFRKSSVLRKLNQKDYHGAAAAFLLWNKAGGRVSKGLSSRRQREKELFLK